jgi:phosphoglycerate dehydrogenase-like enzyme
VNGLPRKVLVTADLPEWALGELRDLDSSLEVVQLNPEEQRLYASRRPIGPEPADGLARSIAGHLREAKVLITFPQAPDDLSSMVPNLEWLQLLTAGADELPDQKLIGRVPVTTLRGVRARAVAEYGLLLMLAFAKRFPDSLRLMQERRWSRVPVFELRGRTLGIVGLGSIGSELASLAVALGMRVIGTRRGTQPSDAGGTVRVLPAAELPLLLEASDFVVLTAPATRETAGLIGSAELRRMRPHAYLINLARGSLLDEPALLEALRQGWIAGAALDVTLKEPLPESSPLYGVENLLLTCHNAGMTDRFLEGALPVLKDNLRRFLEGRPLLNLIEPARGY